MAGPALGDGQDLVEDHEAEGGAEDECDRDDRPEDGQGQPPETLPAGGAVHRCRLVDLGGDALDGRVVEQDVEGRGPPHVGNDDGGHGEPGMAQPVDVVGDESQLVERSIQVPVLSVDDEGPQEAVDHRLRQLRAPQLGEQAAFEEALRAAALRLVRGDERSQVGRAGPAVTGQAHVGDGPAESVACRLGPLRVAGEQSGSHAGALRPLAREHPRNHAALPAWRPA